MEIEIKKIRKIETRVGVKKYCCSKMKRLHKDSYVVSIEQRGMFLSVSSKFDCSFREQILYCPFCGKKIEVIV